MLMHVWCAYEWRHSAWGLGPGPCRVRCQASPSKAEHITLKICDIVKAASASQDTPRVRCVRACDAAGHCLHLLTNLHDNPLDGPCVFNDMTKRLPSALGQQLQDLLGRIRASELPGPQSESLVVGPSTRYVQEAAILLNNVPPLDPTVKSHCEKRMRPCLGNPLSTPGATSLLIAGVSCLDYTSMGKRNGVIAKGALPFMTLAYEIKNNKYDITVIECTPAFKQNHLAYLLGLDFQVNFAWFSPCDLGHPASRTRQYIVVL